jgi:hypothetical protein
MTKNELFELAYGLIEAGETHGMDTDEVVEFFNNVADNPASDEVCNEVIEMIYNGDFPE